MIKKIAIGGAILLTVAAAILFWLHEPLTINGVKVSENTQWRDLIHDEDDQLTREDIRSKAESLLLQSRLDELEALAGQYRSSRKRFNNGECELNAFYAGLTHYALQKPAVSENWEARLGKLREWVAARPNSATARIALSECLVGYAFAGRGSGYANTVSEQQWALFGQRMAEAQAVLFERPDMQDQCPQWRAAVMRFHGEEWTKQKYLDVFSEAFSRDPGFAMYTFRTARLLLPRWYGQPGEMEAFCASVADGIGGTRGDILYAQTIWFLDSYFNIHNLNERNPRIDWQRVKRGIESIGTVGQQTS